MNPTATDAARAKQAGRWPWGLIAMIGLVVQAEWALVRLDGRWQTPGSTVYRFTGRALDAHARRADVLVLGDSVLKFGMLPRVLEDRLGLRAFNLAHIGGQPHDTFFVLRRALARGARPTAVVLDFKPNLLQTDPLVKAAEAGELRTLADCLDLGWTSRDLSYFSRMIAAKALPSFRYRDPIRAEALAALNDQPRPGKDQVHPMWRNWKKNLGAHVAARNPGARDVAEHWDERAYLLPTFSSIPLNTAYIHRTLELARRHRLPVYWVILPINPRVQKRREELGIDAAYAKFVRVFLDRYPNLTVVDGRHAGYGASLFVDAAHLDRLGASALTIALADVLHRGPAGRGWLELPPYREPASVPPMEDIDQSRTALNGLGQSSVRR